MKFWAPTLQEAVVRGEGDYRRTVRQAGGCTPAR